MEPSRIDLVKGHSAEHTREVCKRYVFFSEEEDSSEKTCLFKRAEAESPESDFTCESHHYRSGTTKQGRRRSFSHSPVSTCIPDFDLGQVPCRTLVSEMISGVERAGDDRSESADSANSDEYSRIQIKCQLSPPLPLSNPFHFHRCLESNIDGPQKSKFVQDILSRGPGDKRACLYNNVHQYIDSNPLANDEATHQTLPKSSRNQGIDLRKCPILDNQEAETRSNPGEIPPLLFCGDDRLKKPVERVSIHPKKFWSYASAIEAEGTEMPCGPFPRNPSTNGFLGYTSHDSKRSGLQRSVQAGSQISSQNNTPLLAQRCNRDDQVRKPFGTISDSENLTQTKNITGVYYSHPQPMKSPAESDEDIFDGSEFNSVCGSTIGSNISPNTPSVKDNLSVSPERCSSTGTTSWEPTAVTVNTLRTTSPESYFSLTQATSRDSHLVDHLDKKIERPRVDDTSSAAVSDRACYDNIRKEGSSTDTGRLSSQPIQEDMTELSSSSSFNCEVCGEAANGNFFGAIVCLPCKSFFIRCTKDNESCIVRQCRGRCDINKQLRNRCQFCRYQRCLMVGMTRKEKPESIQAQDGQELCRVCGDLSNGIHFGVFTCEGCKKFFRRGLKEHSTYVCKERRVCRLTPRNRNSCRLCRYQKCISVGMSRKAIKMGRPRKLFANWELSGTSTSHAPTSFHTAGDYVSWRNESTSSHHYDTEQIFPSGDQNFRNGGRKNVRAQNDGMYIQNTQFGVHFGHRASILHDPLAFPLFVASPGSQNETLMRRSVSHDLSQTGNYSDQTHTGNHLSRQYPAVDSKKHYQRGFFHPVNVLTQFNYKAPVGSWDWNLQEKLKRNNINSDYSTKEHKFNGHNFNLNNTKHMKTNEHVAGNSCCPVPDANGEGQHSFCNNCDISDHVQNRRVNPITNYGIQSPAGHRISPMHHRLMSPPHRSQTLAKQPTQYFKENPESTRIFSRPRQAFTERQYRKGSNHIPNSRPFPPNLCQN